MQYFCNRGVLNLLPSAAGLRHSPGPPSIKSGEFGGFLFPFGIEFGEAVLDVD
jgi:hypothetical protein